MRIVGLYDLKSNITEIISNSDAYKKGGAHIPHMFMNLTHENGQSTVADYITSKINENNLRKFCGLDTLLEYRLSGELAQLKRVFEDVKNNAVYRNAYEGVVAIDISALSEYINEYQVDYFIEQIEQIGRNATLIIYYDKSLGKRMKLIKESVIQSLGNCIDITVDPYSIEELAEIVVEDIKKRGIKVDSDEELEMMLCDVVEKNNVKSAKQAVAVAEELTFYVDYSGITPEINAKIIGEHFRNIKVH